MAMAAPAYAQQAEALPSVARSDIEVVPSNRSLRNAIRRNLNQYRDSLRAVELAPVPSRLALGERQRIVQLLENRGYYNADVIYRLLEAEDGSGRLQYRIDTDEAYTVLSVRIEGHDFTPPSRWPQADEGSRLVAEQILADQSELSSLIDTATCFFRLSVTHEVQMVDAERGGHVVYRVNGADPSTIGQVRFEGDLDGIEEPFLLRQTGLRRGDCFNRSAVDQAILNLYQTQLFASVRRTLQRQEDGSVDIAFELVKRPPRTLSSGIGWDTDQGLGLRLGWEHRNLAGRAQRLQLGTELREQRRSVSADVTIPGFLERRNTLNWANTLAYETPSGAEYYLGESRATISRQASSNDTYRFGIAYRRSDERVGDEWDTFSQFRFPLAYQYDELPGALNPRRGLRYSAEVEPVISLIGSNDPYWIGTLGWSSFRPLGDNLVLANRLEWTSIWPLTDRADLATIPNSDRLLAGGGGSVRGYPYRSIGVGPDNDGGTQQWEGSLELRSRFAENWGAVVFTDVASISEQWNPIAEEQDYLVGVGVGLRYYTRVAPVRLDVAFPVQPRDDDPRFQLYISLGQSF
ncbi:MAG: autotransporter assembly complex protein TamA [Saccharospirillum sp.]